MNEPGGRADRPLIGRALRYLAAALLFTAAIGLPDLASAERGGSGGGGAHGGGGGFHGGGSHGGGFHGGGFHGGMVQGGGFHGGGFHGGGFHGGVVHGGGFHHPFGGRGGVAVGLGGIYAPFAWGFYYPYADYYGYPDYGYYQPYAGQYWYYCSDPAGYYPYVTECNTGWQPVPAG